MLFAHGPNRTDSGQFQPVHQFDLVGILKTIGLIQLELAPKIELNRERQELHCCLV